MSTIYSTTSFDNWSSFQNTKLSAIGIYNFYPLVLYFLHIEKNLLKSVRAYVIL